MPNAIDPATGEPVADDKAATIAVPAEEWGAMKAKLDVFEKSYNRNTQQTSQPITPSGPTIADQIKEVETQIDALDRQIDENIADGKPVAALMKKRTAFDRQITRLQIKSEDIDPIINAGMHTIDQLSSEVSRGKMKYFDIVKDDYESLMSSIPTEQRSSLEIKQKIYDIAVGQNIERIMEAQKEEILRAGYDTTTDLPNTNGRSRSNKDDKTPKPADILSRNALQAIKSRGLSVDDYYKRRGYKDGWKSYFSAHEDYYKEKGLVD